MNFYSDIWNKFLEFESNIGDLSSIVKTEKRRSTVLNQVSVVVAYNFINGLKKNSE
jgi:hypothetical protein